MDVIIFLILNLIIYFVKGNHIKIHFYKENFISLNHIDTIFFSKISTNVSFGTPSFNISLEISTDTPYFVVKGSKNVNEYKQENSSSFFFIKYGKSYVYKNTYFHAVFFNENFRINNQTINLYSMMNWSPNPISINYGLIGLQLYDIKFQENNIFINQLYDKGLIKEKMFSLIYENEFKGELIIGDYPHNKTRLLNGKKLKVCNNTFASNGIVWGTIFEEIKFGKNFYFFGNFKTKDLNYIGLFSNVYYGIIGSKEYNIFINETFFKYKLENKLCWIQKINDDKFYGYVCSNKIDTSNIPPIKFYHKGLNYIFEIENKEMWLNYNNLKYFIIFFSYDNQYSWILGQKFLEKYPLILDGQKNLIGLYYKEEIVTRNYYYLYIIIILIIVLIIVYVFYKNINLNSSKNKQTDVELEDLILLKK